MKKQFLLVFLIGFTLASLWSISFAGSLENESNAEPKRVLAIFAFKQGLPFAYHMAESLRIELMKEYTGSLILDIEHADRTRFPEEEYLGKIIDLYQYKYGENQLDLILLIGGESTNRLLEQGADLFDGIPVVLVGVGAKELPANRSPVNTVSMSWGLDFDRTLNLINDLLPEARNIFVVSGNSLTDEKIRQVAASALERSVKSFEAHYLVDYSVAELYQKVAVLPDNSVILFLSLFRDGNGEYFISREVAAELSRKANAPTFGNIELYLGHGIVGGDMVSADFQGHKYAVLTREILEGVPLEKLELTEKSNQVLLDWRQLKRWSIDESKVPEGYIVRYREPTMWEEDKWNIVIILIVISAQALALLGLIIQYRRRSHAEKTSNRLRDERARITRVLAMGEIAASLAHELNQPLSAVRSYAQAALRQFKNEPVDSDQINIALEGVIAGNRRAEEVIKRIRMALKNEPSQQILMSVDDIIPEVIALVSRNAAEKNVVLQYKRTPGLASLKGDRIQLQQVLFNLIINGIEAIAESRSKFGTVIIRAQGEDSAMVTISVQDNGVGIDEESTFTIFDSFYTTKNGGMGLGLSISRTIVEDHGGRLWAEGKTGKGSTFSFSLPGQKKGTK